MPITTNVASSNPAQARCTRYNIMWYGFQWLAAGWWFSPGTRISSSNKTDRHNTTEVFFIIFFLQIPTKYKSINTSYKGRIIRNI